MRWNTLLYAGSLALATLISCNDKKETNEAPVSGDINVESNAGPAAEKQEQKEQANSVMAKLAVTPELSTFSGAAVNAELTNFLLTTEGPLTLFVPSDEAIESLEEEQRAVFTEVNMRSTLVTLLNNHITGADWSSADLLQRIKRDGEQEISTLGGAKLTAYLEDGEIFLKDNSGNVAQIGKSDIMGSNGKVHVINKVLTLK